jgi:hypothetical protein
MPINPAVPADDDIVSQYPAAERAMRGALRHDHAANGRHARVVLVDREGDRPSGIANTVTVWQEGGEIFQRIGTGDAVPVSLTPIGGIIMWSGALVDIPAGWQLCDGTNGTPDLQNRFILAAGEPGSGRINQDDRDHCRRERDVGHDRERTPPQGHGPLGSLRYGVKDFHTLNAELESRVGEKAELVGIVASEPERRDNTTRFILRTEGERVLVNTGLYAQVKYGDEVRVEGKLGRPGVIDDGSGRPFNYAEYLSKEDVYFTMSFAQTEVLSSGHGNALKRGSCQKRL